MESLDSFFEVRKVLASFLKEDIGTGDITSDLIIQANIITKAEIICKTDNVIVCGLEEACNIFELCGCPSKALAKDGTKGRKGKPVMTVAGSARSILKAERAALNLLMRMSGIATETRRLASIAHPVKVAATRKTAPGLRYFDKKAVIIGGGLSHRMRLDDMVLIKDNHIALTGSIKDSVRLAKEKVGRAIKVECEVKDTKEAVEAIRAGADIIMLDNFTPARATKTIKEITRLGLRKNVLIEISGGVNHSNVKQYRRAKPDYISMGHITHSSKAVDFSLEII